MQQGVNPSVYNQEYFLRRYGSPDLEKLTNLDRYHHIYKIIDGFLSFNGQDQIIDFGCGSGALSFYLYLKYNCSVIGLDYSQDAIDLCQKSLNLINQSGKYKDLKEKINFQLSDLKNLPDFSGIKAVFLVDVIEHLYDNEIDLLFEKVKKWSGREKIYLVIHTDNNNYLRFVRPVIDFLTVCFGKNSYAQLNRGYAEVSKGHINLTTVNQLRKKLSQHNFEIKRIKYPPITLELLRNQLGPIAKYQIVAYPVYFFGKILYFLRPSFYMLAKYDIVKE